MRFIRRKALGIVVLLLAAYLSQMVGCTPKPQEPEEPLRPFGPQVSMVVYFKSGTDNAAMNSFSEQTLRGGENKLALVFDTSKPGHRGVALTFSTETTPEQRDALRKAVRQSPIVYQVFENVILDDVQLQ